MNEYQLLHVLDDINTNNYGMQTFCNPVSKNEYITIENKTYIVIKVHHFPLFSNLYIKLIRF